MKKIVVCILILIISTHVYASKIRVAVIPFKNSSSGGTRVGTGLSDMLITELLKTDTYSVFTREQLDEVIKEQKLGMSGLLRGDTAAQVGKLIGVDAIISGTVTEFSDKVRSNNLGGLGGLFGNKLKNVRMKSHEVRIGIDVRIIDVETGETIASEHVNEQKKETGGSVSGTFDVQSSGFDRSLAGRAAHGAVKKIVKCLKNIHLNRASFVADIVKVSNKKVYISAGRAHGVSENDEFEAYRLEGEPILDMDGNILEEGEEIKLGSIRITVVKEKLSIGIFTGDKLPARGDKARAK